MCLDDLAEVIYAEALAISVEAPRTNSFAASGMSQIRGAEPDRHTE
jgi:hypothetical protein